MQVWQDVICQMLIARIVECLIVALWTHKHKEKAPYIKGVYSNFRVPRELAAKVLRKGLPLMVNEGLWSLGMTALTQCYSIRGLEAISASNISSTVSNLFFCAVFAFANAISIIVGHLLENNPELSFEGTDAVVAKLVPPKKAALVELNMKALELGKNYK